MLNQVNIIGNLGADPEVRSFQNGGKVCNLRVAVTEKWKKDGETKERTEWVTVAIFSEGLVGVAERFLRKGSKVYLSGKLQTRKWQDQSGADRYSTEVVLQGFDAKLVMLDGPSGGQGDRQEPRGNGGNSTGGGFGSKRGGFADDLDDEVVPFATSDIRMERRAS